MNKKFNVIKISGFKGLFIVLFLIGCFIAGFLTFPGWVCMNLWNFTAKYLPQLPVMTLVHGILLWAIIALSAYALNKGDLAVSFNAVEPVNHNEKKIREIIKKINEKNSTIMPLVTQEKDLEAKNEENDTIRK